jgi:hypothetical protein
MPSNLSGTLSSVLSSANSSHHECSRFLLLVSRREKVLALPFVPFYYEGLGQGTGPEQHKWLVAEVKVIASKVSLHQRHSSCTKKCRGQPNH